MKKHLLTLCFLQILSSANAQTSTETGVPMFRISDVQIMSGSQSNRGIDGTIGDFRKLIPNSTLLNTDLSGFGYSSNEGYWDGAFTLLAGFQLRNQEGTAYRKSPLLRVGFSYFTSTLISESYGRQIRQRVDTLVSSQTGEQYYVDSVANHYLGMNYESEHMRLDVSMVFHSNPAGRWSFFAGAGVNAGIAFNAISSVYYSENGRVESDLNNGPVSSENGIHVSESNRNKSGFSGSIYLPLGVDFRIARKNDFFSKAHLFYEMRPSFNMISIPELGNFFIAGNTHNIGFRYNW